MVDVCSRRECTDYKGKLGPAYFAYPTNLERMRGGGLIIAPKLVIHNLHLRAHIHFPLLVLLGLLFLLLLLLLPFGSGILLRLRG